MNNDPHHLSYLIHHLSAVWARSSDALLQRRCGIGLAQYKILDCLKEKPEVKQLEVAMALGQTEASISRQMRLLQAGGLIVGRRNPHNKREHLSMLTARGVKTTLAAGQLIGAYYDPLFDALSDRQSQELARLLRSLHGRVCGDETPAA